MDLSRNVQSELERLHISYRQTENGFEAQAILQFYTETLAHKNPTWDKILHPDN
ncbi:MAG: hypothetical protein IKI58_01115 [Oscillospiraceae bacterium]|nr:hypothetical protein [Oscillospiraceae bacterium]